MPIKRTCRRRVVGRSFVDGSSRRHVVAVAPAEAQLAVHVNAVVLDAEVVLERLPSLLQLAQRLIHVLHLGAQLLQSVANLVHLFHQPTTRHISNLQPINIITRLAGDTWWPDGVVVRALDLRLRRPRVRFPALRIQITCA